jgi:PhnB protein
MSELEISMIVYDVQEALQFYKAVFEINFKEATNLPRGQNRAVFEIYGITVNIIDENHDLQLIGPRKGDPKPVWFKIFVPNIEQTYGKALVANCLEINPIIDVPSQKLKVCMFTDPYGYIWQLQQRTR